MSKYQEALDYIDSVVIVGMRSGKTKLRKSKYLMQELVDKATPKGATFTSVGDWRDGSEGLVVECPECKFEFKRRTKYCSNCGQKIDWT